MTFPFPRDDRTIYMVNSSNTTVVVQVYTVVDEMFLAGEMRETSQTKVKTYSLMYFPSHLTFKN